MSRTWLWLLLVPAAAVVLWRGLAPGPDREAVAQRLRAHHATILRAHLEDDLQAWMDLEADDYLEISRGEILRPSRAERRARRMRWLEATDFSRYEDLSPPTVHVSPDGDAGWVACEVAVQGIHRQENGETAPVEAVWAWVEIYERQGGVFRLVANASSRRP